MPPYPDKQMRVVDCTPLDSPVQCRLQVVMRDEVGINVINPLEVLHQSLQLVVSCDNGLRVDPPNRLVLEQDCLLAERRADRLASILQAPNMSLVLSDALLGLADDVSAGLDDNDAVLSLETSFLDLQESARNAEKQQELTIGS